MVGLESDRLKLILRVQTIQNGQVQTIKKRPKVGLGNCSHCEVRIPMSGVPFVVNYERFAFIPIYANKANLRLFSFVEWWSLSSIIYINNILSKQQHCMPGGRVYFYISEWTPGQVFHGHAHLFKLINKMQYLVKVKKRSFHREKSLSLACHMLPCLIQCLIQYIQYMF